MLWLESPAGVGWSLADSGTDMSTNDMMQSRDALAALKSFYVKFPELMTNELYVSGESYAGIYVPYLSWQIYQNNLEAEFDSTLYNINLGGFMVGNGATNWDVDVQPSFPETLRYFNIIKQDLLDEYRSEGCDFYFYPGYRTEPATKNCKAMWARMKELSAKLNWYDLYRPTYPDTLLVANDDEEARISHTIINGEKRSYRRGMTPLEYTPWVPAL